MNRLLKGFFCFFIIFAIIVPQIPVIGEENEIVIKSAADFERFAKRCTLDSWSVGKKVVLKKSIDISKTEFDGIPTFGGTFDGQGNSIVGLSIGINGAYRGLFRYVKEGATVKNLRVLGNVCIGGTGEYIGGIVGSNNGTIIKCYFGGNVSGKSFIGGISGINLETGSISDCTVGGSIYGEHYVGGIAGQNLGTIISCGNDSSVNTTVHKAKFDIEDINFDKIISTQNTLDITDIGGIAGLSAGIIQSCNNRGTIGYKHVGYNIGGIAGRQSGYMSECKNTGGIYGRKDVGGIVGQAEPYTVLKYSPDTLGSISSELSKLESLIDNTLNSADANQRAVSTQLNRAKGYADDAITNAKTLADKTDEILNGNADNLNDTSARLTSAINGISNAINKSDDVSDNITGFADSLSDIVDTLDKSMNINSKDLNNALDDLSKTANNLRTATNTLKQSLRYFRVCVGDAEDIGDATEALVNSIENVQTENKNLRDNFSKLSTALTGLSTQINDKNFPGIVKYLTEVSTQISEISTNIGNAGTQINGVKSSLSYLGECLKNANIQSLTNAIDKLSSASGSLATALTSFDNVAADLETISDGIDYDGLKTIPDKVKTANNQLKTAIAALNSMTKDINAELKDLSSSPLISIITPDSDYRKAIDNLSGSMSGMSNVLGEVNASVSSDITSLLNNVRSISDQIMVVLNLMIDEMQESYSISIKDTVSDHTADVSIEDTDSQTTGKIGNCENAGEVNGDVNVGGISGSIAFEYDFDPEDDIKSTGKKSVNFMYNTRAVIRDCFNNGNVTGKKNNVGGICGKLDLGSVLNSNGCGYVKSTSGDYVGGIAGSCKSTIKNCNSRCTLSGDDYVGGIAGEAAHIFDCRAVAHIEDSDEYVGAIAGKTTGDTARNYFCGDALGGIDSISYSGVAQPVTIDELINSENGSTFKKFTATFKIDGKTVGTVDYEYGASLSPSQLPKIPKKDGYYSKWDTESFDNLTCDVFASAKYFPYVSAVGSKQTRKSGLSVAVSEGMYTDYSVMTLNQGQKVSRPFQKFTESWNVSVSQSYSDKAKIHYLVPDKTKGKVTVLVSNGKHYRKVKYEKDGKYIVFDANGSKTDFVVLRKNLLCYLLEVLTFIVAAAIIALASIKILKKN